MEQIINQLKQSPLFNLSLSSKELFHSNFLSWFFEHNPKITADYFSEKTKISLGVLKCVKRENRNLDLLLFFENKTIAIENKIKSIPQKSQLEEYKGRADILFVLSIYKPQNFEDYNFIHYGDIAELFQKQSKSVESSYLSGLYKDYSDFIFSLLNLTQEWMKMEKFDFHSRYNSENGGNNYHNLREIRIHDLYHKIKYNQLSQLLLETTIKEIPKTFKKNLFPYEHFSNSTGAASLWYFLEEKKEYIELQIQDFVIRLMIISNDCALKKKEIAENWAVQKMYSLFDEEYMKEITDTNLYPVNASFNQFGNNVIYRQKKIVEIEIKKLIIASSKLFSESIQIAEQNKNELLGLLRK